MWCILDTLATTAAAVLSKKNSRIHGSYWRESENSTNHENRTNMCGCVCNALIMIRWFEIFLCLQRLALPSCYLKCVQIKYSNWICAGNWQLTHARIRRCTSKWWENERCDVMRWSICVHAHTDTGVNLNYVLWMHKYNTSTAHMNKHICSIKRAQVVAKWCHWLEYAYCLITHTNTHLSYFYWEVLLFYGCVELSFLSLILIFRVVWHD